jgi:hypothetical protein
VNKANSSLCDYRISCWLRKQSRENISVVIEKSRWNKHYSDNRNILGDKASYCITTSGQIIIAILATSWRTKTLAKIIAN